MAVMQTTTRAAVAQTTALKPSDLKCEPDFVSYVESHRGALLSSARSAYRRRRAWLAATKRVPTAQIDAVVRERAAELLAAHPGEATADAWVYASKVMVAIESCLAAGAEAA